MGVEEGHVADLLLIGVDQADLVHPPPHQLVHQLVLVAELGRARGTTSLMVWEE